MPGSASAAIANDVKAAPTRTLIVDDSVVVRTVLERILVAHADFSVVHKTSNAEQALALLAQHDVDLVLLDVEMPGQSGLVALPAILEASKGARVVILSANCEEGSAASVEALALGASDIISKPVAGSFGDQFSSALLQRLGRLNVSAPSVRQAEAGVTLRPAPMTALTCLAIGASTGGIHALAQLFAGMRRAPGVPVLVTQHLPRSFIPYFAEQLARMTSLPVSIARPGQHIQPDNVYIAPGEGNLELRQSRGGDVIVSISADRAPSGPMPAVDPMFSAMARLYGPGCCAIVLTGMGRDGATGAHDVVDVGGWVIAQDQTTSTVWGMPGSVARAGLASALLPPGEIMDFIASHAGVEA